jgi:hypothetical protein
MLIIIIIIIIIIFTEGKRSPCQWLLTISLHQLHYGVFQKKIKSKAPQLANVNHLALLHWPRPRPFVPHTLLS